MKTVKLKFGIAALCTVVSTTGFFGVAYGNTSSSMSEARTTIARDVSKIKMDNGKIERLRKQCRDERAAKENTSLTHSDIMSARADLNRDKAYLRMDKDKLMKEHQSVIKERSVALRAEKKELRNSQKELNADLAQGNTAAAAQAGAVVTAKNEIREREMALHRAIRYRNSDLLAVNREIKGVNGQSPVILGSEDAAARAQNLSLAKK